MIASAGRQRLMRGEPCSSDLDISPMEGSMTLTERRLAMTGFPKEGEGPFLASVVILLGFARASSSRLNGCIVVAWRRT